MRTIQIGTFCPNCNEFVDGGMVLFSDDRPNNTALLEDFCCQSFVCDKCGTTIYTPDYESMCEIEEEEVD